MFLNLWFNYNNNVKSNNIELAIWLTCDILGHKLGVVEREILKDHSPIEVDTILITYTGVGEGIYEDETKWNGEPITFFFDIRIVLNLLSLEMNKIK